MVRSAAGLGVLTLALLALAGCAPQAPAPAPPAPMQTAGPSPLNPDQDFLDRAGTGTATQIELGRLAQHRGFSGVVRGFGAHIAAEHVRANSRLRAVAQQLGLMPHTASPDVSGLAALGGPDFDRQFIADQVKNQQEALALFEGEAQGGQDPRLRRLAREWVPILRRDLRRAETIAARTGA